VSPKRFRQLLFAAGSLTSWLPLGSGRRHAAPEIERQTTILADGAKKRRSLGASAAASRKSSQIA
jgi:hypothetical protein